MYKLSPQSNKMRYLPITDLDPVPPIQSMVTLDLSKTQYILLYSTLYSTIVILQNKCV